jgi:hypothetical protein
MIEAMAKGRFGADRENQIPHLEANWPAPRSKPFLRSPLHLVPAAILEGIDHIEGDNICSIAGNQCRRVFRTDGGARLLQQCAKLSLLRALGGLRPK